MSILLENLIKIIKEIKNLIDEYFRIIEEKPHRQETLKIIYNGLDEYWFDYNNPCSEEIGCVSSRNERTCFFYTKTEIEQYANIEDIGYNMPCDYCERESRRWKIMVSIRELEKQDNEFIILYITYLKQYFLKKLRQLIINLIPEIDREFSLMEYLHLTG